MTPRQPTNGFESGSADGRACDPKACAQWEEALVEAARAGARQDTAQALSAESAEALEHAGSCGSCEERLAGERALSAELHLLSAADSTLRPSAGCEAVLLAALRGERGREVRARRWIFAVAGSLAAFLLILVGAALLVSRDSGSLAKGVFSRFPAVAGRHDGAVDSLQAVSVDNSAESASDDDEDVTDFYAFYPGADLSSVDSGALVRVRVPVSEMGAFGLQVDQGNEDEWVNADLLVAEDGSPQAIRFVLPSPPDSNSKD